MAEITSNIARRLKIARKASGYATAKKFTEKYSIPASTYCQHENGNRALSIENLFNYADLIKIDPYWLLSGQGNPCGEYGNPDIQQKILEEQEKLEQKGDLTTLPIPLISNANKYSTIDIMIFKKILKELLPLLRNIPESKTDDAISFCFDLYNKIVSTNTSNNKERTQLIRICLESFFNGLGLRIMDDMLTNIAMIG